VILVVGFVDSINALRGDLGAICVKVCKRVR
jgi:hypothetical protein